MNRYEKQAIRKEFAPHIAELVIAGDHDLLNEEEWEIVGREAAYLCKDDLEAFVPENP
jgi:hypothetical protein